MTVTGKFQKALESGSFDFGRGMSKEDLSECCACCVNTMECALLYDVHCMNSCGCVCVGGICSFIYLSQYSYFFTCMQCPLPQRPSRPDPRPPNGKNTALPPLSHPCCAPNVRVSATHRWKWAIKKVIRQKAVAKVTVR